MSFRPDIPGENHLIISSEVTGMATKFVSFRKRSFLNPVSTDQPSYIHAVVESSRDGEHPWGTNMLTIADCRRAVQLEFFLGTKRARQLSLAKIDLLIRILTSFRAALANEIAAIEKGE
jgi:hypothetical protein